MANSNAIMMLYVPEKKATPASRRSPLGRALATAGVITTRWDIEKPVRGSVPAAALELRCSALLAYYRALPDVARAASGNFVRYAWHDCFRPSKKASTLASAGLERAAVLFNLAAVHSRLGAAVVRGVGDGRRRACDAFQRAAGVFAFLREGVVRDAAVGCASVDVSAECVGMLERLMLAQAQECFFEKAIADAKHPGLCSKIARQVSLYYEEAAAALTAPPLDRHLDKTWHSYAQTKAKLYHAEACYRCSLELHERGEIAEEIARLKSGLAGLAAVKKLAKGAAASAVSLLELDMSWNLERANRENGTVYFMRVPSESSLPPLPAASLVRPTPMDMILGVTEQSSKSSGT